MTDKKKAHYKTWGKYTQQTVRQHCTKKNMFIIRQENKHIEVGKGEVDSLIMALLQIRQ